MHVFSGHRWQREFLRRAKSKALGVSSCTPVSLSPSGGRAEGQRGLKKKKSRKKNSKSFFELIFFCLEERRADSSEEGRNKRRVWSRRELELE